MSDITILLPMRIRLIDPPLGHAFCLQRGKGSSATKLEYQVAADNDLAFELDMEAREGKISGSSNFTGPYSQGTPTARFFYLCVGRAVDGKQPDWSGRVKVPLSAIPWRQVEAVLGKPDLLLEASYEATNKKGTPALATVPLLDGGWIESPR
jgi:hypothetical protein